MFSTWLRIRITCLTSPLLFIPTLKVQHCFSSLLSRTQSAILCAKSSLPPPRPSVVKVAMSARHAPVGLSRLAYQSSYPRLIIDHQRHVTHYPPFTFPAPAL